MQDNIQKVNQIKDNFLAELKDVKLDISSVNELKAKFVGKAGLLNQLFKEISSLQIDQKKIIGSEINKIKDFIELELSNVFENVKTSQVDQSLKQKQLDITIPSPKHTIGTIHPITKTISEIVRIFSKFGFDLRFDREIETDFYNFDALNFAQFHPARGMHDTFFVETKNSKNESYLLRTHTSSVQIRAMSGNKPPFCFLSPGKTYRCDMDRTHTPMFNQIEGVLVEKNISFANLKWIIEQFLFEFFDGIDISVRFRPSFFPFTEPSAEVDIAINGKYLEVMGCGMIHSNVLKNCGINQNEWSGFAFGLGVERFAMLKYSIEDLRDFFNGKKWWLDHY